MDFALGGGCEIALALYDAPRERECQAGAARGEAGDYPGVWRHAAAAAPGGQGPSPMQMVLAGEMITAQESASHSDW